MRAIPFDIGTIHFTGIGGIGMSGIAEIMNNLGYQIQGSDISESINVKRLKKLGIPIATTQTKENLVDIDGKTVALVVASAAIPKDNPEMVAARKHRIPIVDRAEMLGEVMNLKWSIGVAGTHGKTTTTSIVGTMLDVGDFDPTVINGGIVNAYGTNAKYGDGDWVVAEACEAFGSFTRIRPTIGVITNIDAEHLDHYKTFDNLRDAFRSYLQNLPFYGFGVVCIDDHEVQALIPKVSDRQIYTYGLSPQADVQAFNIRFTPEGTFFDVMIGGQFKIKKDRMIKNLKLNMPGKHNVLNALVGVTIGLKMGMTDDQIKLGLANFTGVKRRFTQTGKVNGVTIIDDYGHHPVEISAVLTAARQMVSDTSGKVIAVFQPHRYSRLQGLFDDFCTCFNDANTVIISDVYAGGEQPIKGFDRDALVNGLIKCGHKHVLPLEHERELPKLIRQYAEHGDIVICLGAGSITKWANTLPENLEKLCEKKALK